MKKLSITGLLLLCMMHCCLAQFAALSIGGALPAGSFSNQKFSNQESGFAQSGFSYGLSVLYPVHSNFGITADFGRMTANFNSNAYTRSLNLANPLSSFDMLAVDQYRVSQALTGIYAFVPFNQFTLGVKLQAGFAHVKIPEKRITEQFSGRDYTRIINSATDVAPAYSWGLMAIYKFNSRINFIAQVDNIYTPTSFQFNYFSNTDDMQKFPVNIFRIAFGIGISLQRN